MFGEGKSRAQGWSATEYLLCNSEYYIPHSMIVFGCAILLLRSPPHAP